MSASLGASGKRKIVTTNEARTIPLVRASLRSGEAAVIVLGLILLVLGLLLGISLLYYLGAILLVVGIILFALGASGRPVGGRQWY